VAALRDAGGATVVVTSRERLRLAGERVYPVAPLAATEAVELFSIRTAAIGADGDDGDAVRELCSRLDNLPLAIELAAARAGLLTPAEMLARLGGRLDRLQGDRDADPRQQTLRATIAWSHDLLDQPEQDLFARLAVFAGGATLEAVEAVCDANLDVLASLLDKNLVRRSGERVWMLETIREFATEQLNADPCSNELHDRHASYCRALAQALDEELRGPGQVAAFERFAAERDNLRAALERLLDRDPAAALALAAAHFWFWFVRSHLQEGSTTLLAALERADPEPTEARASAVNGAAFLAFESGDHPFEQFEEALACARAAGSRRIESIALSLLSHNEEVRREKRIRLGEEAIAVARASGDRWLLGVVTGNHGSQLYQLGETAGGRALTEEACRLCRRVGDASMTALYLNNLAWYDLVAGNPGEARAKLAEALELARQIDDTRTIANTIAHLGWTQLMEGDVDGARSDFREVATIARQVGRRAMVADAIWGLAQSAAAAGDPDRAARLAGAATTLGMPDGFDPALIPYAHRLEEARVALGDHAWEKAWADGTELDLDAALALALD
jgi:tetratricopeptide (TPR) repeat protein